MGDRQKPWRRYRERSGALWRGWDRRLPGNLFVARQLAATQCGPTSTGC